MQQNGIFVTGTDTDVGKTYVGQTLIRALVQQAINVRVRKPVESGWSSSRISDAALLAEAAAYGDDLSLVCANPLQAAVSPARAATLEAKVLTIKQLKQQCLMGIKAKDFLYIEGAGGFYSPLANDGLNADLAQQLNLPILLVAEDKLGCINHILLTLEVINKRGLTVLAIVLNQFSNESDVTNNVAMNNYQELSAYTEIPIFRYAYKQMLVPQGLLHLIM